MTYLTEDFLMGRAVEDNSIVALSWRDISVLRQQKACTDCSDLITIVQMTDGGLFALKGGFNELLGLPAPGEIAVHSTDNGIKE